MHASLKREKKILSGWMYLLLTERQTYHNSDHGKSTEYIER